MISYCCKLTIDADDINRIFVVEVECELNCDGDLSAYSAYVECVHVIDGDESAWQAWMSNKWNAKRLGEMCVESWEERGLEKYLYERHLPIEI